MAVRRPGSLSTELSTLDRRITTIESKTVSGISSGITTSTDPADDEGGTGGPGKTKENPPYSYRKVVKAYIYGGKVTGNSSRLELYFAEDPEIEPGQYVRLQGLHGTSTDNFELSPKTFKVLATDTEPWDDLDNRGEGVDGQLRRSWRDTPTTGNNGETVTHTVFFNPVVEVPKTYSSTSGRELITTRRIDTMSVTGSTVTVTLNSTHLFEVGDVVYVDSISTHTVLFGVDGLFKVSEVVSSTVIKYELDSPVPTPFSLTSGQVGTKYVYPVAQGFVEEGTIWTDTGSTPNRVFVWKDYRWYDTAEGVVDVAATQDGIAPSPVTSLAGTSTLPAGTTTPVIDLTWTPPTTRSNGASISGFLDGYDIWYKRSTETLWKTQFVKAGANAVSSAQINDAIILQNFTYNIRVYAVDIMAQYSTVATVNVLTAKYSETLNPPSKPTVSSRLGTITVSWDGNDSTGNLPVRGVLYVEVHRSTTSGFTPSSSTLISTIQNNLGGDYVVVSNLSYATNYYFKLVFVRQISPTELEDSNPSTQSDAIQVSPLVDTDVIANTISGAKITPGTLIASEKIVANSITSAEINALAITAGKIAANAIEADKIAAGAITASIIDSKQIDLKASDGATQRITLTSNGITAYNSTGDLTFSLNGTTGTINAASINVQNINANNISAGIIQGIEIRTADTANTRTVLNQNDIKFYIGGVATEVATVRGFLSNVYDYQTNSYVSTNALSFTADAVTISGSLYGSYVSMTQVSAGNIYAAGRFSVDDIRRYTANGQIKFTTTGGTTAAYIDTSNTTGTTFDSFWITGRVSAGGAYSVRSSRRFKTNIKNYTKDLSSVLDLNLVTYQVNPNTYMEFAEEDGPAPLGPEEVGLIAEEVAELGLDGVVVYDPKDPTLPYAIDYTKIGLFLVPVVRELKRELNDLKDRIDNL